MDVFCIFVAALIVLRAVVSVILDTLHRNYALAHSDSLPRGMDGFIDMETFAKSVRYTTVTSRYLSFEIIYESAFLAFFLFSGVLPWLYRELGSVFGFGIFGQAAILIVVGVLLDIPDLPVDWWHTFRIEESFGFNKSTKKLWIADKLKGVIVSGALMYPLLCLLLLIVRLPFWWVWGFACMLLFQLVLMVVYPMWIMPLFNKFSLLPDGELKERLLSLAQRTGFYVKTIFVMDGSKRSGHSNAFFTGMGKSRRVVLFDTLVEQLTPDELEAVLAHEIGHYKLGHIPKMLAATALLTFCAFALIGWLAASAWFVNSFGFSYDPARLAPVLLLFGLLGGLVTFWLTPLGAMFSRKHEYQADAFSLHAMQNDPRPLISALRKLHTKNLGNLVPHPLYSAFHYSHPTLPEREAALNSAAAKRGAE